MDIEKVTETPSVLFPELIMRKVKANKHYSHTKRYVYGTRLKRNAHRRTMSVHQRSKAKNH